MIKNSILLCTRNEEKYVENTIRNLNKFIPNVEIIIVDDQSKDNTKSIDDKKTNLLQKYNNNEHPADVINSCIF